MADNDPRRQLLENLLQELQNYQLPERYDEAKKAEIRRGRKGQAQIDEGRRAIAENERLYQEALAKRQELQTKIQTLSNDIDTARSTAREQQFQDWERSPAGQAYEIGKWGAPMAGGVYLGHRAAKGIQRGFEDMSIARQQSAGLGRRFAPYGAKAMTYFVPEGLAMRYGLAPQMKEGTAKDIVNAAGTGLLSAGAVTTGEGIVRALQPRKIPGVDDVPPQVPPPPPQNALDAAGRANRPGALPPPDETPPAGPSGPRPHSERLIAAARAAGATGKLTKADAVKYLKRNVTDQNRGAVARALNVKSGPNLATRIGSTIKTMASTRGASSMVAPLIAAGAAYELAGEPAEAADGTSSVPGTANRLAAAGVAGGAAYGLNKLAQAAPMAGNMAGPIAAMTFDPLEGGSREDSAENIRVARATAPWPINRMLGVRPEEVQTQDMSALPSPNPLRTTPEPGNQYYPLSSGNALEVAGREPTAFGAALADFMSLLRDGGFGEQEVMR